MPPAEPLSELSQGARRVLEAVREVVIPDCDVHPGDVLRAVWEVGSRGAEIIEASVGAEEFEGELAWLRAEYETADDNFLGRVLTEARMSARVLGRQQEIGTEHLLAGVLLATPLLARRWEERGLSVDRLLQGDVTPDASTHGAIDVEPDLHLVMPSVTETGAAARLMDAAANRCRGDRGLRAVHPGRCEPERVAEADSS
jgi:hypothetical protein